MATTGHKRGTDINSAFVSQADMHLLTQTVGKRDTKNHNHT